jgi:hypothetical protein
MSVPNSHYSRREIRHGVKGKTTDEAADRPPLMNNNEILPDHPELLDSQLSA